ncbi:MAG: radical SAM protein [Clostridia bacterium]|nr:radical SAM protein [Clostridia bacterium]
MQTIREARKNIALLWRRPKPSQTVYRPMKFLLQTQVDEGLLLCNVVTSELVLLDGAEREAFERLPAAYVPEMDELIARHYAVPESFDENRSVRELRALLRKLDVPKRVNGFTILPTTECNARCFYCFESDHKRCTLTEEMADDVVEYIARVSKGGPVEISWFGGEPLVGSKRISQICAGLRARDIRYRSSMVSNAYLFDEELIRVAKNEWNLKNVQITLDGTETVYNETKAYVNPRDNPYRRVLRNINLLLDNEILVNVRLNVTDKNYEDLNKLVDELIGQFAGKSGFSCYSHAVYDGVGFEPLQYDDRTREQIDAQTSSLDAKLQGLNLLGSLKRLPSLRVINCMSDNDGCRLIYPDGKVGKCENRPSLDAVGDIYQDITDPEKNDWYKTPAQSPGCRDCCLFPTCMDLKSCPEAGACSRIQREWRVSRYLTLISERYREFRQNNTLDHTESSNSLECET